MIQALPHAAANPSPAEWRTLLANVQAYSGGLCNIEFLNMNNYGQPLMLAGSVFELNGRKYICTQDHPIEWEAPPTTWRAGFIYARVPTTGGEVSLTMRTCDDLRDGIAPEHAPRWQPAKGGWYASFNDTADQSGHTNFNDRRVIAKFFYGAANQWRNKVVLSRYNSRFENNLYNVNSTFPYVSGDGALYYSAPEMAPLADTDELVTRSFTASNKTYLCPGVYRYEMRGGNAGRGGAGGSSLWWGGGGNRSGGRNGTPWYGDTFNDADWEPTANSPVYGRLFSTGENVCFKIAYDGGDGEDGYPEHEHTGFLSIIYCHIGAYGGGGGSGGKAGISPLLAPGLRNAYSWVIEAPGMPRGKSGGHEAVYGDEAIWGDPAVARGCGGYNDWTGHNYTPTTPQFGAPKTYNVSSYCRLYRIG